MEKRHAARQTRPCLWQYQASLGWDVFSSSSQMNIIQLNRLCKQDIFNAEQRFRNVSTHSLRSISIGTLASSLPESFLIMKLKRLLPEREEEASLRLL